MIDLEQDNTSDSSEEFAALQVVHDAMAHLSHEARSRILVYIASLFGIDSPSKSRNIESNTESIRQNQSTSGPSHYPTALNAYSGFAEIYGAFSPENEAEKALVSAYWSHCQGHESFEAQTINKNLKDLGFGLKRVTDALEKLKKQQPAMVLQLRKEGKGKQGRKIFKITHAGQQHVEKVIRDCDHHINI